MFAISRAVLDLLPRAAFARAGLSNRLCPSSSVIQKISKTGDLEAKTISKREDNDEIRHILAYVYLMKYKAVVFSAFPPFF